VRYDWLSHYTYSDISELQGKATELLWPYNDERSNIGLGGIIRIQKLKQLHDRDFTTNPH
jgi:putative transposase